MGERYPKRSDPRRTRHHDDNEEEPSQSAPRSGERRRPRSRSRAPNQSGYVDPHEIRRYGTHASDYDDTIEPSRSRRDGTTRSGYFSRTSDSQKDLIVNVPRSYGQYQIEERAREAVNRENDEIDRRHRIAERNADNHAREARRHSRDPSRPSRYRDGSPPRRSGDGQQSTRRMTNEGYSQQYEPLEERRSSGGKRAERVSEPGHVMSC
jgi:hypothetical protein